MKVNSFTKKGKHIASSCSNIIKSIFPNYNHNYFEGTLYIITSHRFSQIEKMSFYEKVKWRNIHNAWVDIQSTARGKTISAWRTILKYGMEIVPGLRLFILKNTNSDCFFCLIPNESYHKAVYRTKGLLLLLSVWKHIKEGHTLHHAAGLILNNSAFIFLGISGAGKSTISNISAEYGYKIIHDDHIVIYKSQKRKFYVSDRFFSKHGGPLRSIFFLIKDNKNFLKKITQVETAKKLLESSLDSMANQFLYGKELKYTFTICCDIARIIPGYNLHFRKSTEFLKVIDAEFRK